MLLLAALWLPQHATKATSTSNFTEDELIHLRTDSDAARISFGLDRDVYLVRKEEGELELGGQLRLSGGQGPERGDHAVSKSYMDNALAELREEIANITGRCLTALRAPAPFSCIHACAPSCKYLIVLLPPHFGHYKITICFIASINSV